MALCLPRRNGATAGRWVSVHPRPDSLHAPKRFVGGASGSATALRAFRLEPGAVFPLGSITPFRMKTMWPWIAPVLGLPLLLPAMAEAAPAERSISPSRQFIIYGPNVPLRGAMGDLAERTKSSLLRILQKHDDWKTPIILNLRFRQANVPEMPASQLHVSQTGIGLKLQLDLTLPASVDPTAIQRDLLRAILIELVYRDHPETPAGTLYAEVPPWLIEGVLCRGSGEQRQTLNDLLTAAAESSNIISLQNFVGLKPEQLDAPARLLYRAYAAALLQFLLDQPAGSARLAAYIESLSRASNDPLADLRSQFPGLGPADALEGLWKSAVSRFAATAKYEFLLSFKETQSQLDQLLRNPIPNSSNRGKALELEKLGQTKPTALQVLALRSLSQNLLLLATSAHPLLRPVVVEYQEIAQVLAARKNAKIPRRLEMVKAIRARIANRMMEMDDFMNWFEATQLSTKSGAFTDYLKAAGEKIEPERRRHDALSVYLDAVEAQFRD